MKTTRACWAVINKLAKEERIVMVDMKPIAKQSFKSMAVFTTQREARAALKAHADPNFSIIKVGISKV